MSQVTRTGFRIGSTRKDVELNCYKWIPDGEVRAVLFISHGMMEHILRYDAFAEYLNGFNIAVYGHDHMGHGGTSPDDRGFFAEKDGDEVLVNDLYEVCKKVEADLPGVPRVVLGHSMGSFVTRRFLTKYGDSVDGAILMSTGQNSMLEVNAGLLLSKLICKVRGTHYKSKLLFNLILGPNNKPFKDSDDPLRWLSTSEESRRMYDEDPDCGFDFIAAGYRDLLTLVKKLGKEQDFDKIPKDLNLLFVSGSDDVIGEYKGTLDKVIATLRKYGLDPKKNVYEGLRHELLVENGKEAVFEDIKDWILALPSVQSPIQ